MRERRHHHIDLLWLSNMKCRQMAERILSGKMKWTTSMVTFLMT